jgi:hypothetical protein
VALISAVDRQDMAVATALSYLYRYSGQVIGVALSSAFLQGILTAQLERRITGPGSAEVIGSFLFDFAPRINVVHKPPSFFTAH